MLLNALHGACPIKIIQCPRTIPCNPKVSIVFLRDNIRRRIIHPRKNVVGGGGQPPLYVAGLKKCGKHKRGKTKSMTKKDKIPAHPLTLRKVGGSEEHNPDRRMWPERTITQQDRKVAETQGIASYKYALPLMLPHAHHEENGYRQEAPEWIDHSFERR